MPDDPVHFPRLFHCRQDDSKERIIIMAAQVDEEKCTGCETCVEACPVEAITMENEKAKVDADACTDCGTCVDECPAEAITVP